LASSAGTFSNSNVTITNTGVRSLTTNTGLSSNVSATGAVTITQSGIYASSVQTTNQTLNLTANAVTKLDQDFQAAENGLINVDIGNNWIEIDENGVYEVTVSGTLEPNDAATTFKIDVYKNTTPTKVRDGSLIKNVSTNVPFSFTFVTSFTSSEWIFPTITSSTSTNGHIMHYLNFCVKRLY